MARGLSRYGRTPRAAVRDRRNAQRLGGAMSLMCGGAIGISDEGLIVLNLQSDSGLDQDTTGLTVVVQDVLAIDASGIKLNFGSGLYSDSGTLKIELDSPSGLDFSANRLTVVVQGVIDFDASGIKLVHGLGLRDDGGTLKTADGEIVHNDLSGYVADEHIDWTGTTENLLTTGTITIDSDANGIIFGDAQDATLKWDDGSGVMTLSTGLTLDSDITISSGSIVSVSGTISFGDEDVVTTGSIGIGTASPFYRLDMVGDAAAVAIVRATQYSNDGGSASFFARKARGTAGIPIIVRNTDELFKFLAYGHTGYGFVNAGRIECVVDGAIAGTGTYRVPSRWRFYTVEQGDTTAIHQRLVITHDGTIDCKAGNVITTGTLTAGGAKVHLTPIGGIAVALTNKTGANSVAGQLVKADPATDDAVILTAASDDECLGVFLDSGIADGSEAWVVVAGIADVAMEDNTAATRGNWVETSNAEAGYADATSASPAAAPVHFEEIGHCIESVAAGGGGTHILARCVLHFN